MLLYRVEMSMRELELIRACREVKFGEIYGAEIPLGEIEMSLEVNQQERALIWEIRSGQQYIDVLHVHEGRPVYMEVHQKVNGFNCRQKIKLPTE